MSVPRSMPLLLCTACVAASLPVACATARIETHPVHASHVAPAVEELMLEDEARIEAVIDDLAEQDVESVVVDLCLEPGTFELSAEATLSVAPTVPVLEFRLHEDLTIFSVTSDGRPLRFRREGEALTVRPGPLTADVFQLVVRYGGTLKPGPAVRLQKGLVVLEGSSNWYPAPRYGDRCTFRTIVRYPEGYTSVCTGALAGMTPSRTDTEEACVLGDIWDTGVPVASAAVLVGSFASSYSVWGDVFLGYHVLVDPGDESPEGMDAFVTELKGLVRYLESCYGPYPFEWLSVVFVPGFPAELAPAETAAGVVVLTDLGLLSAGATGPRPERVVAGLSKIWWPHSIDAGRIVSEGLSGHSELSLLGETGDEESVLHRRERRRRTYIAALSDSGGRAPLRWCLNPGRPVDKRICGPRSQAFMDILELLIGRDAYCAALRSMGNRFRGGMLPLREFISAFESEDGRDLDWLVYEWLYRGDLPTYVLTYDVSQERGRYVVRGTIAQRGEVFRTPVPLTVDLGVWSYDEWITIRSPEQAFELTVDLEPQSLSIDSGHIVPRIEADELANVHFERGQRSADANEWGTAVDEFGAASELVPGNAEFAFRYGEALIHSGRLDLGLAALEEALSADPSNAEGRMELARLYLVSGRGDKALSHLQRYISMREEDPVGHTVRAMALIASGRLEAAQSSLVLASMLADSTKMDDDALELLSLARGRYHEAAGDSSMAAAAYREALKINPVSDEARRALARIATEGG